MDMASQRSDDAALRLNRLLRHCMSDIGDLSSQVHAVIGESEQPTMLTLFVS